MYSESVNDEVFMTIAEPGIMDAFLSNTFFWVYGHLCGLPVLSIITPFLSTL